MIDKFDGTEHRFLSNFWAADVVLDGEVYPSVEHAYQAAKTLDKEHRKIIQKARRASTAKVMGQIVEYRADWAEVKKDAMLDLLRQKFKHQYLAEKLLATGSNELVEVNTWGDTYWGVCNGVGENNLGKLLMQVRAEITKEQS